MADSAQGSVKSVYVCYPEDPNPEDLNQEFSMYTRKVFLQTVNQFITVLQDQPTISIISRAEISSDMSVAPDISEAISNSDCILLICCPALVYLVSSSARDDHRLEHNQTVLELKTILGQCLIHHRNRVIPVFLNTSSDSVAKNIPPEIMNTAPVSVCITTIPEGGEELWPAQQHSIDRLIRMVHKETVPQIPKSQVSELNAVNQEWCLHFMDQFAIDFIACVFEERAVYTDCLTLTTFLAIQPLDPIGLREVLRIWLRTVRQRKVFSLFEELKVVLGKLGREDLAYQLKCQYELYKEEVYQEQSLQSSKLTQSQATS